MRQDLLELTGNWAVRTAGRGDRQSWCRTRAAKGPKQATNGEGILDPKPVVVCLGAIDWRKSSPSPPLPSFRAFRIGRRWEASFDRRSPRKGGPASFPTRRMPTLWGRRCRPFREGRCSAPYTSRSIDTGAVCQPGGDLGASPEGLFCNLGRVGLRRRDHGSLRHGL